MFTITTVTAVLALAANLALAAPTPEASHLVARQGYTEDCFTTYSVESGDTCNVIIDKFNDTFTLDEFYSWNPQVAIGCYNLYPGEIVCAGLNTTSTMPPACPVPVAAGLVSNCDACYAVAEGDNCYGVAQAGGITIDELRLWNPSLNAACTNLQLGYNYCVGVEDVESA
ncbi:carbohydrate-binding module family 50 protein [Hypoxylon crocopeplum]|nr:carbohydrate-binding module family 50 protein [Hypoxylon crocopeplum]